MKIIVAFILGIVVVIVAIIAIGAIQNARQAPARHIIEIFHKEADCQKNNTEANRAGRPVLNFPKFAADLSAIDVSACPKNFQEAWVHYTSAVDEFSAHANGVTAIIASTQLLHGNATGFNSLNERKSQIEVAVLELKQSAVQDGVKFNAP